MDDHLLVEIPALSRVPSLMEPCARVSMFICGIYIHVDVKELGQCLKFNAKDFTSKMFYSASQSLWESRRLLASLDRIKAHLTSL